MMQAPAKRPHCFRQTPLLGNRWQLDSRRLEFQRTSCGRFSQLDLQRKQFGDRHRHQRPVKFRPDADFIATPKFGFIQGLFESPEFDFAFVQTAVALLRQQTHIGSDTHQKVKISGHHRRP